jgi:hypothetical protein
MRWGTLEDFFFVEGTAAAPFKSAQGGKADSGAVKDTPKSLGNTLSAWEKGGNAAYKVEQVGTCPSLDACQLLGEIVTPYKSLFIRVTGNVVCALDCISQETKAFRHLEPLSNCVGF